MEPVVVDDRIVCREGKCERCNGVVESYGGRDAYCDCGAIYNCFGQRLRDDLNSRPNMSEYDDDIGDMEGFEAAYASDE